MVRSHFAAGLAVGGLAGLAIGYLISRGGQLEPEPPTGTIDLTPALEVVERRADAGGDRPAPARRAPRARKKTEE